MSRRKQMRDQLKSQDRAARALEKAAIEAAKGARSDFKASGLRRLRRPAEAAEEEAHRVSLAESKKTYDQIQAVQDTEDRALAGRITVDELLGREEKNEKM